MSNDMRYQPTAEGSGAVTFEQPLSPAEQAEINHRKTELVEAEMFVMNRFSLSRKEFLMMKMAINGLDAIQT